MGLVAVQHSGDFCVMGARVLAAALRGGFWVSVSIATRPSLSTCPSLSTGLGASCGFPLESLASIARYFDAPNKGPEFLIARAALDLCFCCQLDTVTQRG